MKNDLKLSGDRLETLVDLKSKKWFKKTSIKLQNELLSLPEDFEVFLRELANRPEIIGNVEVVKLIKICHGNFIATPVFEVRSLLTNQVFTHEYASWKYGKQSGYRGIILVEIDGTIAYFVMRKNIKFPIASIIYDAIGMLEFNFKADRQIQINANLEKNLKKILELKELSFKRFIDLGVVYPDGGLTNNQTAIFAGVVAVENADILKGKMNNNLNTTSTGFSLEIQPIDKIYEYITKSDDAYFLSCIARLVALNILKL